MGKQSRKPSRISRRQDSAKRTTKRGQGTHADIAGGGKIVHTLGGARYVLALTDDATNIIETHLLKKSRTPSRCSKHTPQRWKPNVTQEWFRSDNGGKGASRSSHRHAEARSKRRESVDLLGATWARNSHFDNAQNQSGKHERKGKTGFVSATWSSEELVILTRTGGGSSRISLATSGRHSRHVERRVI